MKELIERWLDNSPKETAVCSALSLVSLVLSLSGACSFLPFDIAWVAIVLSGVPILTGAFKGVVFEHDIKADLLVSLALVSSVIIGEYFAAGEVALIMQIGSLLEDYTSGKAEKSLKKLIDMTPRMARVITEDGEEMREAENVAEGDGLRVLQGEIIPVDGRITSGSAWVDQSVMTGESVPVEISEGDEVMSGTMCSSGTFTMRCIRRAEDSSLQRMIKLTEQAREDRAPVVEAADRWATWLVVFAVASSLLTWAVSGEFIRAVTLLVVFCPCAFILATPTAVLAGIGNLAKHGVIVKSGASLQRLCGIKTAAFDKTGTLTEGALSVEAAKSTVADLTDEELLAYAAAAEKHSEHPIGKAIAKKAQQCKTDPHKAEEVRIDTSFGVSALVDGKRVICGKRSYLEENGVDTSVLGKEADDELTTVYVSVGGRASGYILLSDALRKEAPAMADALRKRGVSLAVLTGDSEKAAKKALSPLGDVKLHSALLPDEKMDLIREYSKENGPVVMIGDGVNDAPALSLADASVAMGGIGSDIAVESSDAVLVSDDIMTIPYILDMSERVMKKIKTNLTASVIINLTAMVLSAAGMLTPVTGALWHNIGSVFVVVNAATLLKEKQS